MMPQSKARSHFVLQCIGIGYVAYIMLQMILEYIKTPEVAPLGVFLLIIAAMCAAEGLLVWFAVRNWKRDRKREEQQESAPEESE